MSDNFKALLINQEGENFTREIKNINKSFLKHGDVFQIWRCLSNVH